jgi:hypothetical protein
LVNLFSFAIFNKLSLSLHGRRHFPLPSGDRIKERLFYSSSFFLFYLFSSPSSFILLPPGEKELFLLTLGEESISSPLWGED